MKDVQPKLCPGSVKSKGNMKWAGGKELKDELDAQVGMM